MKSCVLSLVLLVGCTSTDEAGIVVTDGAFAEYWTQLERREPAWFELIGVPVPALPPSADVKARVRFVEFEATPGSTCYFNPDTWTIRIGNDKWASGCVPHELGHAALHLVHHPCAPYFEHSAEVWKCYEAMR